MPAAAKIITTAVYVVLVVSFSRTNVSGLVPYAFYPVLLMAASQTPFVPLIKRLAIALPFALFGGLANIFFERDVAFMILNLSVTYGVVSFVSIFLKTLFTVAAVLILIATTPMTDISDWLIRVKVPAIFVLSLMMTYRYISVLLNETATMYTAYKLRSPDTKGVKFRDMGVFVGQLLLRSIERAERIYVAMKCRGFNGMYRPATVTKMKPVDFVYIVCVCGVLLVLRFVNLSVFIGSRV
jgi:cobalt/nickel transport system permease protein